ncbi:MAG: glycosyltransferase family 4 protein [Gemmiger sp.]|uniref:glycosyltransferase family 4 protein n=1 Tax=Gemmiger sp. TaxID=2049027 RepID=UPI002E7A59CE|nr:glycosyltransferase family 4 protein [Gemmiger sp.]MEE0800933.1 glycosyltransferase family 4 protein [Gemmiger sp.]
MPKSILVVTQHFWPENFRINDLVDGFLEDGIRVDVLCGLPNYPKGEWFDGYGPDGPFEEEYHGARVFRCREIPRRGNTAVSIFLNYVSWPWYASRGLGRLRDSYDAVFCFNTSPVLMCWPAIRYAERHGVPFTNYVLDIWPENLYSVLPVRNPLLRRIASGVSDSLYRKADRLIAMSQPLQHRLAERTGKPLDRIAVIPQYCEDFYAVPQHDAELERRFAGRFNLVFTGTFTPAQSLDTVIRAVRSARQNGADRLHLLLVGDGMSRAALEELVRDLDAAEYVTFYGSVPANQIPRFTALADALIVSLSDSPDLGLTVPAKVASYMAAGKPVLASMDGAGNAAVAEAGGLSSPACNADALADNLLALYRMPEAQRAEIGRRAKEYYQAHYRRSELVRKLESFILNGSL